MMTQDPSKDYYTTAAPPPPQYGESYPDAPAGPASSSAGPQLPPRGSLNSTPVPGMSTEKIVSDAYSQQPPRPPQGYQQQPLSEQVPGLYQQDPSAPQGSWDYHNPPQQQPAIGKRTTKERIAESVWTKRITKVSDAVGARVNLVSDKAGVERFWPVTGDGLAELHKCERILREFTVTGVPTSPEKKAKKGKNTQILKKIPPSVIANAKGILIFSAFRTGIAPFGGSGGSGVLLTRLPTGQWSAPAFVAPNNLSVGFLLGIDAFNAMCFLMSDEAVSGFKSHHFTIGSEFAVVAGPLGVGAGADMGLKQGSRAPIYTYAKSKGLYAGIEMVGQAFIEREDENAIVYGRKGIRTLEILSGNVQPPMEAQGLYAALYEAEKGIAQGPVLQQEVPVESN